MKPRLTKIICTLGPTSQTEDHIQSLVKAGMDVVRINLSHGTKEEHTKRIQTVRKLNLNRKIPLGILLDTKGAEIRTGDIQTPIQVEKGEQVIFCPYSVQPQSGKFIHVNYEGFSEDVKETDRILLDNGELSFDILSVKKDGSVLTRAREDGEVGSRRHVNLPGADVDLPSLTEKDWEDIAFAVEESVDYLALSFIRTAQEVKEVRDFLQKEKSTIKILTKIETAFAVKNIKPIIEESDGIMIARGDLGAEIPFETLPAIQDEIVALCIDAGKPVIVATHMLESMREHPIPTRAEMTDVSHAARQRTDATMLSGETASGKHPTAAVEAMHKLLHATETMHSRLEDTSKLPRRNEYDARAESAVDLAHTTGAPAIFVFTRTGITAQQISRIRPEVPIIAFTETKEVQQQLSLLYGVFSLFIEFSDPETTIANGIKAALDSGIVQKGSKVILVSDVPKKLATWSIQQREL